MLAPSLSRSALVLGSIAIEMTRIRKLHPLEEDRVLVLAEGVAGARVAEADGRVDVARVNGVDLFALVGVHIRKMRPKRSRRSRVELRTLEPLFAVPE